MPPVKFKPPQPVRAKVPKGRIVPLNGPDIKMGKSFVSSAPQRVTAEQLERARRTFRRYLGKQREVYINVHATYAVTKKADGVKMGQGKGQIDHFVARVPAGQALFHIPMMNPFHPLFPVSPNFKAFRALANKMPMPCHFRSQNNFFPLDRLDVLTAQKVVADRAARSNEVRELLLNSSRKNGEKGTT